MHYQIRARDEDRARREPENDMIAFDAEHAAIHHPADRRFTIRIKPAILRIAVGLLLVAIAAAWIEAGVWGMPVIASVAQVNPNNMPSPHGFPLWVRYGHFFNFLFVMLLIRSGLSILMDHPRLYFNDDCTPGSEWIKFTPIEVNRPRWLATPVPVAVITMAGKSIFADVGPEICPLNGNCVALLACV